MYGTVMIGRLRASREELLAAAKAWQEERQVPGFLREDVLFGDDGTTVVTPVWFSSEEAYRRLAQDPEQDTFWQTRFAPLLDGDPQWIDGAWAGLM